MTLLLICACCRERGAHDPQTVCEAEAFFAAEDANGAPLTPENARHGTPVPRDDLKRYPTFIVFHPERKVTVEWLALGHISSQTEMEQVPGRKQVRVVLPDGGVATHPLLMEGAPPRRVVFAFTSPLCPESSPLHECMYRMQSEIIFGTYACREER